MSPAVTTNPIRVTAKLAVAPRGTVSMTRLVDAFRVHPLARRPRI